MSMKSLGQGVVIDTNAIEAIVSVDDVRDPKTGFCRIRNGNRMVINGCGKNDPQTYLVFKAGFVLATSMSADEIRSVL